MQRDTIFRIASMTKPLTSVLALQLLEEGKLSLSDPVSAHLPQLASLSLLPDPTSPLSPPQGLSPAPPITVEDLLTHRSGIGYHFSSPSKELAAALYDACGDPLWFTHPPETWLSRLATVPLAFPPGHRMHYGLNTDVLGLLVAAVAQQPLQDVMRQRILEPLGMVDTAFHVPREKRHRLAALYRWEAGENRRTPWEGETSDSPPPMCGGGGGLVSTVDDYLRFARMLMGGGTLDGVRVLRPETVALMAENRLTDAQRGMDFLGLPLWAAKGFGLGVSVVMDAELNKKAFGAGEKGTYGWPGAFGTFWQNDPVRNVIVIYLIQHDADLSPAGIAAAAAGQRAPARFVLPQYLRLIYDGIESQ